MTQPNQLFGHDFSSVLSQLQLVADAASTAVSKLLASAPRPQDAAGFTHVCTGAHAALAVALEFLKDPNETAIAIDGALASLQQRVQELTSGMPGEELAMPKGRRLKKFPGWKMLTALGQPGALKACLIAGGLPRKHEHVISTPMPSRQADAYGRAIAMKELSGPEGTLGMIHALRRISLHPLLLEGGVGTEELRVEDSARMMATLEVLDRVAEVGEKALVFLESLDLQDADQLPLLLKRRYGLARLPMVINGQVATEARQARVNDFQRERGFDVMLLSPKAGGVGLTLTAANHVVHLSRWWNPAVEDQCSDRVYRIGQTRPVHIYYPLAVLPDAQEYSFDVQLQQLMARKRKLAQDLLAPPAFTTEDYKALVAGTLRAKA